MSAAAPARGEEIRRLRDLLARAGAERDHYYGELAQFCIEQRFQMTAADFASWVAHMKATRRWSAARCSRELGCGINQVKVWSETGAPLYIALACAALAFGLPPWASVK